ncbi:MAG: L-serine ammonia-lyase, iron-sulfur-dependent, subunit alpha [Caldisericaceae bacterium]
MKIKFKTFSDLKRQVSESGLGIGKFLIAYEALNLNVPEEKVIERMQNTLSAMRGSIEAGLSHKNTSRTGFVNGWAKSMLDFSSNVENLLISKEFTEIIFRTLAVSEMNACMGRIVAAPTAGACGVLPGALLTVADHKRISEDKIIEALFVSGGIGEVIKNQASLSGSRHGCQAEIGSASSMTAGAIVSMFTDDVDTIESAAAFAMKNILGLVCDPIGGYVEIPCIKRNVANTFNAISSAEMALAGIRTLIPFDEVIIAMKRIGETMPAALKETGIGGIAGTPTAQLLLKKYKDDNRHN